MSKAKLMTTTKAILEFTVSTLDDDLNAAIKLNGRCTPNRCMHKVAISRELFRLDPDGGASHKVRIDGGHIKFNFRGYRYKADTPKAVKKSLMLFDHGDYSHVKPQTYKVRAMRTTKIVPTSPEQIKKMTERRRKRLAEGKTTWTRENSNYLRKRIEGFSASV